MDALVQRTAHSELFLFGIVQDLCRFAWIGVVELCFLENVFVVRVDVDLSKGHRGTGCFKKWVGGLGVLLR